MVPHALSKGKTSNRELAPDRLAIPVPVPIRDFSYGESENGENDT
jgi:hypothetical protein